MKQAYSVNYFYMTDSNMGSGYEKNCNSGR
nr:MAG TPA: hypothetical protein [Inoviridae sp.]